MIKNPSFEGLSCPGGWTRDTHTGVEYGEIFVPEGWVAFWKEGDYRRPEVKVIPKQEPFLDPPRICEGDWSVQMFTYYGRMYAGLYQVIAGLVPGETYEFSIQGHAWSTTPGLEGEHDAHCSAGVGCGPVFILPEDVPPLNGDSSNDAIGNFTFQVGVSLGDEPDPFGSVNWCGGACIYNGYHGVPPIRFTAPQGGEVVVYVKATSLWPFRNSDIYLDNAELTVIEELPSYKSTMLILPQSATPEQLQEVFALAFPDRRTFGFSHDDAGNLGGTAILYNIPTDERQAYLDFYAERYPSVIVEFAYTSDWEEPPVPPSGLLLWQCDPKWGDEKIASPDCSLTLCQTGCWVSDAAIAQRYYNVKSDATPSTANQALGAAGGFSGCSTLWTPMKDALGLEVVKRTSSDTEAKAWLDAGDVCFAEVDPATFLHFVMVTHHQDGRYWMLDPYRNKECWLDEEYPGVETWRLIRPFEGEPPPIPISGSLVSLHLQQMVPGALDFVARVKPSVVKIFQLENAQAIKAASPDTKVVLRYYTADQDLSGDLEARAQEYVASFEDSLRTNAKWIYGVESYNEEAPTNDIAKLQVAVEFDCHFASALMALDLPVVPILLNVAVGNPSHEGGEIELMLPAVSKAIEYGGALGYHAYGLAVNGGNLNDAWEYYAGRALEGWDPVFRAHGLYPHYIFGECGAFATCVDGWRSSNCLDGDWPLYLAQLTEFSDRIKAWNALHGNRCLGGTLFTSGGWGWDSFLINQSEMESLDWPL
jgi:hypothetical protein